MVLAGFADAVDLAVYRAGGEVVLRGGDLYGNPVWQDLRFTYPPFSAIVFTPLALVPLTAAKVLVVAVNGALLLFAVHRACRAVRLRAVLPIAAVVLLTEAVHASVYVGQINLLLLALVLVDVTGRGRGIGIGLAAGLKLTPLIFVGYLVAVRRFRDAAVAALVATSTVVAGFLVRPADSANYWLKGAFADTGRIYADLTSPHNQSLRGMLLRAGFEPWVWAVTACVLGAAALLVAALVTRRGERLLGATVVGLAGAAVSPWSWGHHWVWVVPLTAVVVDRVFRRRERIWVVPGALLVGTFPWVLALADPPDGSGPAALTGGPLRFVVGNLYLLLFLAVLGAAAGGRAADRLRHPVQTTHPVDPRRPFAPAQPTPLRRTRRVTRLAAFGLDWPPIRCRPTVSAVASGGSVLGRIAAVALLLCLALPGLASAEPASPAARVLSPADNTLVQTGVPVTLRGESTGVGADGVKYTEISLHDNDHFVVIAGAGETSWQYTITPADWQIGSLRVWTRVVTDNWVSTTSIALNLRITDGTRPAVTCPCTFNPPAAPDRSRLYTEREPLELGFRFFTDRPGTVTGVKLADAAPLEPGTTARLWGPRGLLAETSDTGAFPRLDFARPVPVDSHTDYVVSYTAPTGTYFATPAYFTGPVGNPPIIAGYDNFQPFPYGAPGLYGPARARPDQTYNGANYWVSPVFEPTG
ncbi:glycosyltransferase 87 family protein [Actinokineospora auranticolor]|uniref:Uncharacterized protein DUF4082 n=1 Tax=Actinokineospora auranticolor TaxID=155976 RepID=A0A2S6GWD1_9PSEU|nr:glycosyltransferase 87 family protein [Actinokineospora auranticolor]PPK69519.1 uncharacterized protein DUF4082 [Actinokineospora auranticolor]